MKLAFFKKLRWWPFILVLSLLANAFMCFLMFATVGIEMIGIAQMDIGHLPSIQVLSACQDQLPSFVDPVLVTLKNVLLALGIPEKMVHDFFSLWV